mmetsp:Transcript_12186/g.30665  ORF Transcript_12186/g.30665 Transcript_12186/m.30665 type:complete len:205 (+) Transcript_12186:733-1347(+)
MASMARNWHSWSDSPSDSSSSQGAILKGSRSAAMRICASSVLPSSRRVAKRTGGASSPSSASTTSVTSSSACTPASLPAAENRRRPTTEKEEGEAEGAGLRLPECTGFAPASLAGSATRLPEEGEEGEAREGGTAHTTLAALRWFAGRCTHARSAKSNWEAGSMAAAIRSVGLYEAANSLSHDETTSTCSDSSKAVARCESCCW